MKLIITVFFSFAILVQHVLASSFLSFFLDLFSAPSSPVVQTKTGQIRGKLVKNVYEFTGIPYAEPPTGQRRFQKPVPKTPWSGVFDATRSPKTCIQFNGGSPGSQQSEDCLTLNIYVPKRTLDKVTTNLPLAAVYVFIHGGGYLVGSASEYNGNKLSDYDNIIVATLQYRLGALGFAYFGQQMVGNASANVALWDQLEALKWISENIGAFGGDNQQITVGGESAGAKSVSYHLLSPYSRRYFQRAIIESGTAVAAWAQIKPNDAANYMDSYLAKIAIAAKCGSVNKQSPTADKLRCFRSASVATLVKSYRTQVVSVLAPVVDGDFVPRNPNDMVVSGDFYRVPLLIGFNREEGSFLLKGNSQIRQMLGRSNLTVDDYNKMVNISYRSASFNFDQKQFDQLKQHYRPAQLTGQSVVDAAIQIAGDIAHTCPTYVVANYTASYNVPVYAYVFSQSADGGWIGATHGIELGYIFGWVDTKDGQLLSQAVMQYWGNFIKTGNPGQVQVQACNNNNKGKGSWPVYAGNQCPDQIVDLDVNTQVRACREAVVCHFKADDCSFWQSNFLGY